MQRAVVTEQKMRNSVQVTFVCTVLWKIYLRSILPIFFKIRRVLRKLWRNTFWCVFMPHSVYAASLRAWAERNTRQSDAVRLHLQPSELHVDARSSPRFRRTAMTGARVTWLHVDADDTVPEQEGHIPHPHSTHPAHCLLRRLQRSSC